MGQKYRTRKRKDGKAKGVATMKKPKIRLVVKKEKVGVCQ